MGMVLKSVGLRPRGRLSDLAAKLAWRLMQRRRRKFGAVRIEQGAGLQMGSASA
jgi:hypothetical protein